MPRAPKPYDLTTIADVKLVSRKSLTDTRQDDLVQLYISAFSKAIASYCNRQFAPLDPGGDPEVTSTKVYDYDGNGFLDLAPYEARSIDSVALDGVDLPIFDASAPVAESYRPQPEHLTTEGTILSLKLPLRDRCGWKAHYFNGYEGHVEVVGKWGIGNTADVPEDVAIACAMSVADALRNPEGAQARSIGDLSLTEEVSPFAQSLPGPARALLAPYLRP